MITKELGTLVHLQFHYITPISLGKLCTIYILLKILMQSMYIDVVSHIYIVNIELIFLG